MEQDRHLQIRKRVVEVLKDAGYTNIRENYYHRNPDPKGRSARFDVVLLSEDNQLACVIEVKKERKSGFRKRKPLKQLLRYRKLANCPVILIRGLTNANLAASKVALAFSD